MESFISPLSSPPEESLPCSFRWRSDSSLSRSHLLLDMMACLPVNLLPRHLILLNLLALTCWSHPLPSLPAASQASADENLTIFASEKYPSLSKWTSHAYEYLNKFSCHEILFMTRTNCQRMQSRSSESMALYVAEPRDSKYKVSRMDGSDFKYAIHDAVLVIDPFPEKKSNHLVMVFFIDLNVDRIHCEFRNGQYLGECRSKFKYVKFLLPAFCPPSS